MGREVGALAWSPDARYLAGGNALQVWQRDGSDITVAPTTGGYKTSVVWSPDGRVFVAGTDRGLLYSPRTKRDSVGNGARTRRDNKPIGVVAGWKFVSNRVGRSNDPSDRRNNPHIVLKGEIGKKSIGNARVQRNAARRSSSRGGCVKPQSPLTKYEKHRSKRYKRRGNQRRV